VVFSGCNPDSQGSFDIGPSMGQTVMIAAFAFSLLCVNLVIYRLRQLGLEDRIVELREELE
jgi:hypothetical protein